MNLNSQKAFTVVEMLVVVAVVGLLSAVLVSNFPRARQQFSLSQTAYKFAQDVRRAQAMALSSQQYRDGSGVLQPIEGYGVYVTTATTKQYIMYANNVFPGGATFISYDPSDYIVETVDFSSTNPGIFVKEINGSSSNDITINFTPPGPRTTLTSLAINQTTVDVVFALESNSAVTKTVSINTAGLVEVR